VKNYVLATVVVFVALTSFGVTQVSAQWYFNGTYYTTCLPLPGNLIQCSGNLIQSPNGCMILGFLVGNGAPNNIITTATQYYTLQNLPSSYPPIGSWVVVTGQLHQGPNTSPTGGACPGNYITVTSITQTAPFQP